MSTTSPLTPDVVHAAALAQKIRLNDIRCINIGARIVGGSEPKFVKYDVPKIVITWVMTGPNITAILPFSLKIASGTTEQGPTEAYAEIDDTLLVSYKLTVPPVPEVIAQVPHFLGITAYLHAWPYFRADVQMLTSRIGLLALTLPVIVSGQVANRASVSATPEIVPQ